MKLKIEDINKSLNAFTYDELVELSKNVINEMRIKDGNKRAVLCFWAIINRFKKYAISDEKQDVLGYVTSNYTEQEFYNFRGVGEQVKRVAKHELQRYALTFKT